MQDLPPSIWSHGHVPLEDRRRVHRRVAQRRSGSIALNGTERRQGRDRRVRERRETVGEHLRNGLQVLLHCTTGREVAAEVRYDIAAAARRVWLALQELERGKPVVERLDG